MSDATDSLLMAKCQIGFAKPEFIEEVEAKLKDWFDDKYGTKCKVLIQWFDNGVCYTVIKEKNDYYSGLHFMRLFKIGDQMEISQDKMIED